MRDTDGQNSLLASLLNLLALFACATSMTVTDKLPSQAPWLPFLRVGVSHAVLAATQLVRAMLRVAALMVLVLFLEGADAAADLSGHASYPGVALALLGTLPHLTTTVGFGVWIGARLRHRPAAGWAMWATVFAVGFPLLLLPQSVVPSGLGWLPGIGTGTAASAMLEHGLSTTMGLTWLAQFAWHAAWATLAWRAAVPTLAEAIAELDITAQAVA